MSEDYEGFSNSFYGYLTHDGLVHVVNYCRSPFSTGFTLVSKCEDLVWSLEERPVLLDSALVTCLGCNLPNFPLWRFPYDHLNM